MILRTDREGRFRSWRACLFAASTSPLRSTIMHAPGNTSKPFEKSTRGWVFGLAFKGCFAPCGDRDFTVPPCSPLRGSFVRHNRRAPWYDASAHETCQDAAIEIHRKVP